MADETENPISRLRRDAVSSPFPGFEFNAEANRVIEQGARKKSPISGMYTETNTGKVHFNKKSPTNPADDYMEILFSYVATSNVAKCKPVVSSTGEFFVASPRFEGYRPILPKAERGFSKAWLSSNPATKKNKRKLHAKLKTDLQKQDLADILVDCALFKDDDCQIGNLCFFTERLQFPDEKTFHERTRVGKIDHGWAMANLCNPSKNRIINLFEKQSPVGKRATHGLGGIPTNHLNDYPDIVNSHFFIRAIASKITQYNNFWANLNVGMNEILRKIPRENDQKVALLQIAEHVGLKIIPANITTVNDIKKFILDHVSIAIKQSIDSLAINKVLLQIKLNQDENGARMSPKAKLKALKEVIETRFAGRTVANFMPAFKPTVEKLLKDLIKEGKYAHVDPELLKFCSEIQAGRNPSKRFVRPQIAKMGDELNQLSEKYRILSSKSETKLASDTKSDASSDPKVHRPARAQTMPESFDQRAESMLVSRVQRSQSIPVDSQQKPKPPQKPHNMLLQFQRLTATTPTRLSVEVSLTPQHQLQLASATPKASPKSPQSLPSDPSSSSKPSSTQ